MAATGKRTHVCRTEEIERLRKAKGLSIERLAEKAGIHARTVKRILNNKPAYLENISAIASVLGAPCESLLRDYRPGGSYLPRAKHGQFTINISITGTVDSGMKFAALANLTPEVVAELAKLGIMVTTYDSKLTVNDAVEDGFQRVIVMVYGKLLNGNRYWCFVAVKPTKYESFMELYRINAIDLYKHFDSMGHPTEESFGEIIVSGEGARPPQDVVLKVAEIYHTDQQHFLTTLGLAAAPEHPELPESA